MNIITPEIIFDRFASRLYERWDDLDYIIHAESGFEKWAQWELFLCFKDELFPVIYDHEGYELTENDKPDGEFIADIRLEYSYDRENGNEERADLFIAQNPFIYNKVNLDTWKIEFEDKEGILTKVELTDEEKKKEKKIINDLYSDYKKSQFHYVELKTDWWDLSNDEKNQPAGLMADIEKKIKKYGNGSIPYAWKPSSLIAISIVTFYDNENSNDTLDKGEITGKITCQIKGNKIPKLNWLYSHIEDNTYLIGAYRLL